MPKKDGQAYSSNSGCQNGLVAGRFPAARPSRLFPSVPRPAPAGGKPKWNFAVRCSGAVPGMENRAIVRRGFEPTSWSVGVATALSSASVSSTLMKPDDNVQAERILAVRDFTIGGIAAENPEVIANLQEMEPMEAAATFAGLLVMPELQANCLRLEALVHLAVAYSGGSSTPMEETVRQNFERLGRGYCGRMEDPAEGVFAALVSTSCGNFRIFEGIREGTGFYLQRILDIVEDMPHVEPFKSIRDSTECLLKLSDAVAARAGVSENCLGQEMPLATLPTELGDRLSATSALVRFSEEEVARLQIPKESLSHFVFAPDGRGGLRAQSMGHSDLERRPVALHNDSLYLLLPTAVGSAITRLVIESVISMGFEDRFGSALCGKYGQLFYETPMLGERPPEPIRFQRIRGGAIAAAMAEVDPGRFLHLVFFVDGLDDFLQKGLNGVNADPGSLSAALALHLGRASSEATKHAGFRNAITLFVSCGFGRALRLELAGGLPENWRLESIAAHDLDTLNWLPGFDALTLWRLLDSQEAIEAQGVSLYNPNGLLNLVAWSRELGGHLVPHGKLPGEFAKAGSRDMLAIPQNAVRDLRYRVMADWDPRRVLGPEGRWVKVRKFDKSEFEEDRLAPLYGSVEDIRQGRLRGVYVAPNRPWWIEVTAPEAAPRESVYRHWMMLCVWLRRAAPILDDAFASLPPTPISYRVIFEEIVGATEGAVRPKPTDELRSLLGVNAEGGPTEIRIAVGKGFDDGLFQPDNVAERALVEALVAGVAAATAENPGADRLEDLVNRICPDAQSRWIHGFAARSFRDHVGGRVKETPALIDPLDDAAYRVGLGWRIRARDAGGEIRGVADCTLYLNALVKIILDDLCGLLQGLDRRSFVIEMIQNHEAAAHEGGVWKRTARANLALHEDKEAAIRTLLEHHGRLNACSLATRVLLEAAICECPLEGGVVPGQIDFTRAMSLASLAHHLGAWSDAIHWGAIEPRVRITPLGDVHINHEFIDTVYEPFGRAVAEEHVRQDVDSYPQLYTPLDVLPSVDGVLEGQFLDAWQAEFEAPLDATRAFLDRLEDVGRQKAEALFSLRCSALAEMLADSGRISLASASAALNTLTLMPRPSWRVAGTGFVDKDWFPWRFRRRLSVLRRPLIQINNGDDPTIVVAPGLVREALLVTMLLLHSGEIPPWQARSADMRKWIGHANDAHRSEFNSTVARRMRELGWKAEHEIRLTKILGRALDRNYGDIDVLAWRPDSGRVLVIECKNLQFNKTMGEVAEQLADFRGEDRSDGKPDHLKRHLNRLQVLAAHTTEVSKALKLAAPIQMEGHLVFRNTVPMRFAWERMQGRIQLSLFAELDRI
jgi:hypothetical protein